MISSPQFHSDHTPLQKLGERLCALLRFPSRRQPGNLPITSEWPVIRAKPLTYRQSSPPRGTMTSMPHALFRSCGSRTGERRRHLRWHSVRTTQTSPRTQVQYDFRLPGSYRISLRPIAISRSALGPYSSPLRLPNNFTSLNPARSIRSRSSRPE